MAAYWPSWRNGHPAPLQVGFSNRRHGQWRDDRSMAVADVYLIWFRQALGVGSAIPLRRVLGVGSTVPLRRVLGVGSAIQLRRVLGVGSAILLRRVLGADSAIRLRRPPDVDSAIRLRIGQGDRISPSVAPRILLPRYSREENLSASVFVWVVRSDLVEPSSM